ncbi:MAG: hypothetical protein J0I48_06380 [Devosia sp.]|uniref:hypothetical protein n=1 Tax=Devosia sp. 66-22 TaxID=1895753 RepID=UPI000928F4EA|nr:hypothetical protein [Devosia sp. 66-22]MBN9345823.1 hypothetical protein [Devosia sp.]OJX48707.1 MAG: hypothetical protein BGO81_18680 [Devosia sp. 66-22]
MTNMERYRTLSILGAAVALSLAMVVLFVACGLVELLGGSLQVTHAWVSLFTLSSIGSPQAWLEGLFFSVAFGILTGSIFASVHNAVAARGL